MSGKQKIIPNIQTTMNEVVVALLQPNVQRSKEKNIKK